MAENQNTTDGNRRHVRQAMITGVRWLAMARMAAQASNWIITFIVIRLLTPADYGLQAMVAIIYSLLLLLLQSGFDRAIARHDDFGRSELRQFLGFSLSLNAVVVVATWFAAPVVAAYYQEDAIVSILRVLSLGLLLSVFKTIPIGLVWRQLDYRRHALASLIGTVSASVTTLSLAIMGFGVWSLIFGMLATPLVSALYLQLTTRWLVVPLLSISRIRTLITYAFTISFGVFIWMFGMGLAVMIGGQQLSAAELGLFAVSVRLCGLPLNKVLPLANEILYPAYARLQQNDEAAVNVYFNKALASVCLLLFPSFAGVAAVAEWIVPVVLGDGWIGIERIMMIVALSMPFRVVTSMCNPMLQATGNARISMWTGVFAAVVTGTLVVIGLGWGVTGLAVAVFLAAPIIMSVVVWQTRQASGLSFAVLLAGIGPPLAISLVMAIIVYFIGQQASAFMPDLAVVVVQVGSGLAIYTALAAIFSRDLLQSTYSIVRTSLQSKRKSARG